MTRPGDRLRRLAARFCSARARTRLVDPAVADLQAEAAAARRTGSPWRIARTLVAGYIALVKVLVIAVCGDVRAGAATTERAEVAGTRRGAWVALGVTLVATALLELPPLQSFAIEIDIGERLRMATYLVPSTLPLSIPLGLAVATAWILHGPARTRRVAGVALVTAALTSLGMFGNLAWVTPDANQAFRETVMAQYTPPGPVPSRGTNELRLSELRERLREARGSLSRNDVNQIEVAYYRKWTVSAMPLAIVALIVALAFRRAWTRAGLTGMACGVFVAQFALLMFTESLADLGVAQPIVLEWAGNVLCAAATVVIISSRSPARPA